MKFMKSVGTTLVICLILLQGTAMASDWTRWRGPNGNGIVYDANWNPKAIAGSPRIAWETKLGLGYSAVAVKGSRLYAIGNQEIINGNDTSGTDIIYCLDSKDGHELWRFTYPCRTDDVWPGPTASPVIDGDRLYTISDDTGDLYCLNALNGHLLWHRNVVEDFGTIPPYDGVGYSGSPLIEGDLLLLNLNKSGIAFNKMNGNTVWASEPARCSFSTPVIFELNGKRKMANFAGKKLYIQEIATGIIESSYGWETSCNENTADPIIDGDQIFIASAYGKGCILLNMKDNALEKVWQNMELRNQFTCNVYLDGYIYGIDDARSRRNHLKCIEYKTGKLMWSQPMEFGSLIIADKKLIVLDEKGSLFVAEASPDSYKEIAKGKILLKSPAKGKGRNSKHTYWWTNPVLVDGYLYVRSDKGDLLCLDVRK
ncbi:PQQ-binding-like beta-propeller repeat protein [bacterium]|nr:PQQ-binding-like beta-propeller repeat protein [bacterium]